MATEVKLRTLPPCDICGAPEARYDGRTRPRGTWAYMCEDCWTQYGVGTLGTGYGQRLVKEAES